MPPPHVTRETFLANLRQSGLVSDEQLAAVADRLPETHRGRVLARALVRLGLLTKFQAERLLIGRTQGFFLGQYRILDQIGQGGMGRVFKAEHRVFKRIVALKILAPDLLKDERALQLFNREVLAAASLVHPNIVTAFDADHVSDRFFLIMEYVDGPNLDELVGELGPLPIGRACDFVRQAAEGLQCAHAIGMVHRDIKPANLLLKCDGAEALVKISDFGLARLHEQARNTSLAATILVKENTVVGTPDYLSPEQSRNIHKADIRSDLYSLGCTLYYLLTGRVPFPGGSSFEKLIRHATETPKPVEKYRPDVPREVAEVVRRLMAKDPKDRYQTPAEVAAALAPFAVRGPFCWKAAEPSDPAINSDPDLVAVGPDDGSALVGTVPPAADSTPRPAVKLLTPRPDRKKRWSWVTIVCLIFGLLGAVGGLLAAGAVLGLLLWRMW